MSSLIDNLVKNGPVVTDGSWGTQMQARGLKRGESPDSWNLTRPEQVIEVASSYVEAGSQVILTNTFGANRFILSGFGLAHQVEEINREGVLLSRKAAGDSARVFASIGPSGKMLITGEVTETDLAEAFEAQAKALSSAGPDAIIVETMADLTEACIAVKAAINTGLPVVACMVFDSGRDKDRTMMGISPEEAVDSFSDLGVSALGANCGQGIEGFAPICRRMRKATSLPLWMKANAGMPEVVAGKTVYRTTADEFARHVPDLVASGADFIGGCCGTNETFIRRIAGALEDR